MPINNRLSEHDLEAIFAPLIAYLNANFGSQIELDAPLTGTVTNDGLFVSYPLKRRFFFGIEIPLHRPMAALIRQNYLRRWGRCLFSISADYRAEIGYAATPATATLTVWTRPDVTLETCRVAVNRLLRLLLQSSNVTPLSAAERNMFLIWESGDPGSISAEDQEET
jgi:hypothetical protein